MYGGHRLGNNLFANTLVCVKCATGERVWHYQIVHHDLWDYDLPAAPILADITVDGTAESRRSCRSPSRRSRSSSIGPTGKPVWPIEERPVPGVRHAGRADVADAAVSDQAAAVRSAGRHGRRSDRLHAGAARGSASSWSKQYRDRSAVHAAVDSRRRPGRHARARSSCPARSAAPTGRARRSIPRPACCTSSRLPARSSPTSSRAIRSGRISTTCPGRRAYPPGPKGLPLLKPPYGRITAIDLEQGRASRGWCRTATARAIIRC